MLAHAAGVALPRLPELPSPDLGGATWNEWLLTVFARSVDAVMLRAMTMVVDAVLLPAPDEVEAMRAAAARILAAEPWREPRTFFPFIDDDARPLHVESRRRRSLAGGEAVARRFATDYESVDGVAARGDAVLVEHWMHDGETPRATALILHGFTMGYPRFDGFALFANDLYRAGFDIALLTLPAHGARTPPGARFSGERFAMPRVDQLNEVMRQAVYEIHAVANWLRAHNGAPVGLLGLSLGGYLSSLLAGLRDDWAFVVPIVPPVCIGDLAFRFHGRSRRVRESPALAFSRDELRAAYRVHSPLAHPLAVSRDRVLIVAGKGDLIVPPEHPHALWRHWGEPEIHWYNGSHVAPLPRRDIARRIVAHVRRTTGSPES